MKFDNSDLLDRTLFFSEGLIKLSRKLPQGLSNREILRQLIRSGTSVGANYREACEAESSKDFVHKIQIAKKEARETKYWLKLLLSSNSTHSEEIIKLGKESAELVKILASIVMKFRKKK